jgi:hypothetical protein
MRSAALMIANNGARGAARTMVAGLVVLTMAVGCTIKSETTVSDDSGSSVKVSMNSAPAESATLAEGDVRITSTDNVLVLSLIGDTVRMQLSDSLRNSVAAEIKSDGANSDDKSGIAALVTKSVAGVVKTAMGFTVKAAAKDVKNLRYENGHILFEIANSHTKVNAEGSNQNEKATFTEADAKKFIDAVNTKAAKAVAM